jgi:molybdate transport system substrate-binding protein
MKKLAVGLSAALALIWAPAKAQELVIAATAHFGKTANDLVGSFQAEYLFHHNINYQVGLIMYDSNQALMDHVAAGSTLDLFLGSDKYEADLLATRYHKLVAGRPFAYAIDSLWLYSETVDISAGLPFPGLDH